jgi:hypothetical protein
LSRRSGRSRALSSVLGGLLCLVGRAAGSSERAAPAEARLAEADLAWSRRAEGADGEVARPGPVESAIAGYRSVLAENPDATEPRWKLVRALHFRGRFCGARSEEQRRWFEEARRVANEGLSRLDRLAGSSEGDLVAAGDKGARRSGDEASRLRALRRVPGAASLYLWAAVAWGEWALVHGRLAAVMQGAAGKVRDLTRQSVALDPTIDEGGGYRILGRLHDDCPRIPFVTGWVSHRTGIEYLRAAVAASPDNSVNQLFLAEALLRHEPQKTEEARRLLERCGAMAPHPGYLVEDRHFSAKARRRLEKLGR